MLDHQPRNTGIGNGVRTGGAKVVVLFGTRPELIKLAPIIKELGKCSVEARVVSSSQHKDLLKPFLELLEVDVDFDLAVMKKNQTPNEVASRVLAKFDKLLDSEKPDLILVQGDTTTTLAGALAGFNRRIPVGHVEAGLRSGNLQSPFPEEMNRRVVSQIASFHFAATANNRANLLAEGIPSDRIFVTGNPVVDSLKSIMTSAEPAERITRLIESTKGTKRILLTTHRRESFGETMSGNLEVIRNFVLKHPDVNLIFPVHPNPNVRGVTAETMSGVERVHLIGPVDYVDFIALMKSSWLIVSDSGGVQEEAPTLGKPLLVLRENTERPEAIHAGIAKLVGGSPARLKRLLEENHAIDTWTRSVKEIANPFGDGTAARKIVKIIESKMVLSAR
ncbi:MAG TPA: UDP-N-acetylglucosamine 2-epimerase (non-hydrolyzing) [Pyrinomonadaceae bacterium]|nr:UDP-N-acetylglucosamine 2-epimerase (non-hydrolyzing) [Pyrinomonadaceae bacterium]